MYNLLAVLQTIVLSYSHLPINDLFENPLTVTIFILNNTQILKDLFKFRLEGFSKAKAQLFLKCDKYLFASNRQSQNQCKRVSNQKYTYIYLAINHVKLLPLHKHLLLSKSRKHSINIQKHFVQNLIFITAQNQIIDNILAMDEKIIKETLNKCIKGFILSIPEEQKGTNTIIQQISLFLSISEFFHSHIGLVLSIHQVDRYETLSELIQMAEKGFQQDDDQILAISVYCRIFQALPFKITYNQIASLADIHNQLWGQVIRIEQGTDGIIFWLLFSHSPIFFDQTVSENSFLHFKVSTAQRKIADKFGLKIYQDQHGHVAFKSKSLIKESLQNLSLTIVIINIKKPQYFGNIEMVFGPIFEAETKKFSQNRIKKRQFQICERIDHEIDRLSELLAEIPTNVNVTGSQQQIEQNRQIEAQQLAYNIKKWFFIKGIE